MINQHRLKMFLVNYPPLSSKTRSSGGLRFQLSLARSLQRTDRFGPVDFLRRIFAARNDPSPEGHALRR
jgi:hypothetical protein